MKWRPVGSRSTHGGGPPGRRPGGRGIDLPTAAPHRLGAVLGHLDIPFRGHRGQTTTDRRNPTGGTMTVEWNFASAWESIADAQPDRPALVQGDRIRSWGEWDDRSARLAAAFKDLGLTDDGKVASYLYNSIEYMEGVFATWKVGGAPVNVNYRYLEDELEYLLTNSDTEILLFHGALGDRVAKVAAQIPTLKAIVQIDDGSPLIEGALRYEDLIASTEPAPRGGTSGDDLYILYTGGTTGMPKGVMWRNEDLFMSLVPFVYGLAGEALPEDGPAGAGAIAGRVEKNGTHAGAPPRVAAHARHRVHELAAGAHDGRHDRHPRVAQLRSRRALAGGRAQRRDADGDRRRRVRQADGARARERGERRQALRPHDARASSSAPA